MYFNAWIQPLSALFGGKTMEFITNAFFMVNMRSSVSLSIDINSGHYNKLRPLPHNFYLYFNEQIPLWSTWFHSVSVKLCLFEFLPRSHWNDFPFNFFFVWFFSSTVGRYRTSKTMPRGMHVHLLDFNEHVHSEDSMPRGTHIHFQKAHMSFPKKNP